MSSSKASSNNTGAQLQVLTGQDNYLPWVRDFKLTATSEGVWEFYQGTEEVLAKPEREDYQIPKSKKKRLTADAEIAAAGGVPIDTNTLETNIIHFKLDVDEWKENDRKVRRALTLLPQWVDPAIRGKLQEYKDPKDAWEYLRGQYKMTNARALDIALSKMGRLKLQDCNSMQEYLNQHELLKLDIIDAKGTYDDAQLVSKILRGLTPKYNNFVDQYHLLNDDVNNNVKEMTTKLLTYESKLIERDVEKKAAKSDKPKGDDRRDDRPTCTYKPCGKKGHSEEDCRMKKRHQESNNNSTNGNNNSAKNDKGNKPKGNTDNTSEGRRQIAAAAFNIDMDAIRDAIQGPRSNAVTVIPAKALAMEKLPAQDVSRTGYRAYPIAPKTIQNAHNVTAWATHVIREDPAAAVSKMTHHALTRLQTTY